MTATFKSTKENLISIDENKAYTNGLLAMNTIPIFNVFDNFLDYDGHKIERHLRFI